MLPYLLACLEFTDITRVLAKMCLDVVAEVYVAKETDALRILALCIEQMCFLCYLTHFVFPQMTCREDEFADL